MLAIMSIWTMVCSMIMQIRGISQSKWQSGPNNSFLVFSNEIKKLISSLMYVFRKKHNLCLWFICPFCNRIWRLDYQIRERTKPQYVSYSFLNIICLIGPMCNTSQPTCNLAPLKSNVFDNTHMFLGPKLLLLKVKKYEKQFFLSSTLPKNQQKSFLNFCCSL